MIHMMNCRLQCGHTNMFQWGCTTPQTPDVRPHIISAYPFEIVHTATRRIASMGDLNNVQLIAGSAANSKPRYPCRRQRRRRPATRMRLLAKLAKDVKICFRTHTIFPSSGKWVYFEHGCGVHVLLALTHTCLAYSNAIQSVLRTYAHLPN